MIMVFFADRGLNDLTEKERRIVEDSTRRVEGKLL
jgi:hypothetical protein